MHRRGMTLTETLLVISIIGLLLAMTFPAIQAARHASWRMACASNLRQLSQAAQGYISVRGIFPPGWERGYSLHVALLPHLEQQALHARIDLTQDAEFGNIDVSATDVPIYICPVESPLARYVFQSTGRRVAGTNYAGNFGTGVQTYGYNGVFRHILAHPEASRYVEGALSPADVTDGLSRTAMLSEILMSDGSRDHLRVIWEPAKARTGRDELEAFATSCATERHPFANTWWRGRPWTYGDVARTMYNHVLTPNQPSCQNGVFLQEGAYTAASLHLSGVNVVFADGHLEFVSQNVSPTVWRAIGSRNGKDGG